VVPRRRQRRAILGQTSEEYERKLAEWEKEGYDVREWKEKWSKGRRT
jgi:hypothetical protein